MPIMNRVVDAALGIDTHRDTHEVVLLAPGGGLIAATEVAHSDEGFTALLTFIAEHAPGPKLIAGIEGTRSYGLGVSRALSAAGITVVEAEQPAAKDRRGKGKDDRIDATLAARFALRQDSTKLPTPRADGEREALQILLGTRLEMTDLNTKQSNKLKALLLRGDDIDRDLAAEP
jgi:transposase